MQRALRQGDRVLTVSAFLITSGVPPTRVLLIWHEKLGKWLQPGGHVERGQDPIMALIEEIETEVGINIDHLLRPQYSTGEVDVLPLPVHMTSIKMPAGKPNPGDPEHYMIDLAYIVRLPEQAVKEGVKHAWVSKDELQHYELPDDVRLFLRYHL